MFKVFGIRHHGSGSARNLINALEHYQPDCILIEAPADIHTKLIDKTTIDSLTPPVAILIYNPKNFEQTIYLPFTNFSPEWQAIQYGTLHDIPIRMMDLPYANQLYFEQEEAWQNKLQLHQPENELSKDPFGYLAQLAGYNDKERWWEATFELSTHDDDIFDTIITMITELRQANQHQENPINLLREAFMRKQIRKAIKEGFERIAVVCGAWHAPTLHNLAQHKIQRDNAILKGIKKIKSDSCWIPWSFPNLAKKHGYGAGVHSPAWYQCLFEYKEKAPVVLLSQAAKILRQEGFSTSPADVTQAVRLANTLAGIRHKKIPTLEEFEQAVLTVLCHGSQEKLQLIQDKLFIGDKIGRVNTTPSLPLYKDIIALIKQGRLTKYWEKSGSFWLKATATNPQGGLDLRNENDRLKSVILHRLQLINIPWGKQMDTSANSIGSFKEVWQLEWQPLFSIRIIEAAIWGNSLEIAASNSLLQQAKNTQQLQELTPLLEQSLNAQLHFVFEDLLFKFQKLVADTQFVPYLMNSLAPLARILQYGDVRQTNTLLVEALLQQLVPRICIGLLPACTNIKDDIAQEIIKAIKKTNTTLAMLNQTAFLNHWHQALVAIAQTPACHPTIQGLTTRILHDKNLWSEPQTSQHINLAMSASNNVIDVAHWLEGFLDNSGILLIKQPALWHIINQWVDNLTPDRFEQSLPILRRAFSSFTDIERQKIMQLAQQDTTIIPPVHSQDNWDKDRKNILTPAVQKFFL